MEFFTIFEGEGENKKAITINMNHIVKVVHDEDEVIVHLSNGDGHHVAEDNKAEFRKILNIMVNRSRNNPR
jgi:hypothetical protein